MPIHDISDLTRTIRTKTVLCGCGCWVWTGATDRYGYASSKIKGRTVITHRYVFERAHQPLGDLTVDHLCDRHRLCLNPAHMEAVTRAENSVRANQRRWHDLPPDRSACTVSTEDKPT